VSAGAGHSRKLDLHALLRRIRAQEIGELVADAMSSFDVGARCVEQALCDLEWGGYIARHPTGGSDGRRRTVSLTTLGQATVADPLVAADLVTLPMRHRQHRKAQRQDTELLVPREKVARARTNAR
jgi:hypothetical protein